MNDVTNPTLTAYIFKPASGFVFQLDEELSEGSLVGATVTAPCGKTVQIWADAELIERTLVLRQPSIEGVNARTREVGVKILRRMAHAAMEEFDVDCIRIEEARRTSGAGPGRTLGPIAFRRRARQADPGPTDSSARG